MPSKGRAALCTTQTLRVKVRVKGKYYEGKLVPGRHRGAIFYNNCTVLIWSIHLVARGFVDAHYLRGCITEEGSLSTMILEVVSDSEASIAIRTRLETTRQESTLGHRIRSAYW